jgi:acetyl-CoA carboxylase biotin carboxyl carrier protein
MRINDNHPPPGRSKVAGVTNFRVDTDAIRQLAEILQDTGLTEIEVSEKDCRIRVARAPATIQAAVAAPVAGPAVTAAAPIAADAAATDLGQHAGAVKSPMVGIAYLGPEPGAPVYVSVGQHVTAGQTLLLIEAMKTFNQIKAPKAGTVSRILISSGVPVEYGEVLMVVD